MKTFSISLLVLMLSFYASGQTKLNYSSQQIKAFAEEVYQNCPEYLTEDHLKMYEDKFHKITVFEININDTTSIFISKTLSSFRLNNKCNDQITYDTNTLFDPLNFNVLKYLFVGVNSETYILIDGTNYVINIK